MRNWCMYYAGLKSGWDKAGDHNPSGDAEGMLFPCMKWEESPMTKHLNSLLCVLFVGCASSPQLVYDPASIENQAKFEADQNACIEIARNYDLTGEKAGKAFAGAAIGGTAVAGVATAVAGAIFWPAIPFIAAGAAAGGGIWGSKVSKEEAAARNHILFQCMEKRGYDVYTPA